MCGDCVPTLRRPVFRDVRPATVGSVPRKLRIQAAGDIYHVTSRGNRKQPIYLEGNDRTFHLWWFDKVATEAEWQVLGYVQMTNHFHFLVRLRKPNLSTGMQRLNGLYGQFFNHHHDLSGHLFQGRFHSERVESESHLLECARYDDLNPVRAGMCDHPLEWRWGSMRAVVGLVPKPGFLQPGWLLGQFASDLVEGRQRYLAFVEDRLEQRRVA
jgi:REP element-mobilizing transposase RayT